MLTKSHAAEVAKVCDDYEHTLKRLREQLSEKVKREKTEFLVVTVFPVLVVTVFPVSPVFPVFGVVNTKPCIFIFILIFTLYSSIRGTWFASSSGIT